MASTNKINLGLKETYSVPEKSEPTKSKKKTKVRFPCLYIELRGEDVKSVLSAFKKGDEFDFSGTGKIKRINFSDEEASEWSEGGPRISVDLEVHELDLPEAAGKGEDAADSIASAIAKAMSGDEDDVQPPAADQVDEEDEDEEDEE